jgi:hypothetical protein
MRRHNVMREFAPCGEHIEAHFRLAFLAQVRGVLVDAERTAVDLRRAQLGRSFPQRFSQPWSSGLEPL